LLALYGGGIRGVLTLEILAEIERMLAAELRRQGKLAPGDPFVLADYFDYIAGTSTGGIIAAGLALGWSVARVQDLYHDNGKKMFEKISILDQVKELSQYREGPLANTLREYFGNDLTGQDRTLGDSGLRTLLMLVMRNATTDSP
jgi:uncharacterized protein